MTLAEKVGQMTQVAYQSATPAEVAAWGIGSVLSGGGGNPGDGSARTWRAHVAAYVDASRGSRLGIPILYGSDAVHGHNNVLGATIFPHQIGLGATGDADLVRRVARAAALETAATGVRWSFAPCLAVPQDPRWGRTYEGFSEDPALVGTLGRATVEGWHGPDLETDGVLACPKHFVGEGAMVWGTAGPHRHPWYSWWDAWAPAWRIDQGDIDLDESELRRTHLAPFVDALDAGALTVMASYASWHGRRLHAHRHLLTDVLKGELGFPGFVVSDWMALEQLDADHPTAVAQAIEAGIDMVMVPFDFHRFITTVLDLVGTGRLSQDRIDDAVTRILTVKSRLGLLDEHAASDSSTIEPAVPLEVVGCTAHRDLAREAVRASTVVLLDRGVLPVPADASLLAAGEALDDIGIACGGWTISWEGSAGPITQGRTILDGLRDLLGADRVAYEPSGRFADRHASYGVVTVHELPYVEGGGDRADLSVPADQLEVVHELRPRVDRLVVVVISGRPLLIEPIVEVADAVVAGWLPGSEADGIATVLLGRVPATGRLPLTWPRAAAGAETVTGGGASAAASPEVDGDAWPVGHRASTGLAHARTGGSSWSA
jgi:beta-glucosidase